MADLPRFGWPEGVTPEGRHMQYFWSGAFIASLVVGVIVWAAMFWAFIAYRKRKNSPLYPKQTKENLPFELVCTAIPFVLVAVLFYFTVTVENKVLAKNPNPDVTINVTAFKWNWDFGYAGTTVPGATADGPQSQPASPGGEEGVPEGAGEAGEGEAASSEGGEGEARENVRGPLDDTSWYNPSEVHTIGTSDDIPVLVLPVNKTIEFRLRSRDVVHSFWVPDFLFKRDVFPDPEANQSDNVFQVTIDRQGAFVGRCAELCGTYHSAMNFEVRGVPQNVYDAYLKLRSTVNPATNTPYNSGEALAEVGKQIPACGQLCSPRATTTYPFDTNRQAKVASEPGGN